MGKPYKLNQAAPNDSQSQNVTLPITLPILRAMCSQMVMYPEQASGRGSGYEGIQREAGRWVVMDVISFHYSSCFENPNCTPETMNVIGFLGVHSQRTDFCVLYKNETY